MKACKPFYISIRFYVSAVCSRYCLLCLYHHISLVFVIEFPADSPRGLQDIQSKRPRRHDAVAKV